jgi:Leucine-rich repeat (LRR) protein/tetratricopeptide (TPR) repeat protein
MLKFKRCHRPLGMVFLLGWFTQALDAGEPSPFAGFAAYDRGDYTEAERLFRSELAEAEVVARDGERFNRALDGLAWFASVRGHHDEAETLFRMALANREASFRPGHPEIARSLHNLASQLARGSVKLDEAEALFRRALAIREQNGGGGKPDLARTLDGLVFVSIQRKQFEAAESFRRRALAIRKLVVGINGEEAKPFVSKGGVMFFVFFKRETLPDESSALMDRVLEVRRTSIDGGPIDLASVYSGMADSHGQKFEMRLAAPCYETALRLRDEARATEDIATAANLDALAEVYDFWNMFDEAEPLQRRSLAIWERLLGPDSPKVAQRLKILAEETLIPHAKENEARPILERALAIWAKVPPANNLDGTNDREVSLRNLAKIQRNARMAPGPKPTEADLTYLKGLANSFNIIKYELMSTDSPADLIGMNSLSPNDSAINDDGMTHLQGLSNLEDLDLSNTRIGDAGLARIRGLRNLRELNLGHTKITDVGMIHIEGFDNLEKLDLGTTKISNEGLTHLRNLTKLEDLDLNCIEEITDDGLVHLKGMTRLKNLGLIGYKLDGSGLVHLKGMTRLERLNLAGEHVDDAGLAHLGGLTELRELDLSSNRITDAGLVHLEGMVHLRKLNLFGTKVTDAGLASLARLTQLEELELLATRVRGPGLAQLRGLTRLRSLNLGDHFDEASLQEIPHLSRLKDLYLRGSEQSIISPAKVAELRKAMPSLKIRFDSDVTPGWLRLLDRIIP